MTLVTFVQVIGSDVGQVAHSPNGQHQSASTHFAIGTLRVNTPRKLLQLAASEYFMFHRDSCPTIGVADLDQMVTSPSVQVVVGSYLDRAKNLLVYVRQDDAEFLNNFDVCACMIHRDLLATNSDSFDLEDHVRSFIVRNQADPLLVLFSNCLLVDVQRPASTASILDACTNCGRPVARGTAFCTSCSKQHSQLVAINQSREFLLGSLYAIGLQWSEIYLESILHLLWDQFNGTNGVEGAWAKGVMKVNHAEHNRWIYF